MEFLFFLMVALAVMAIFRKPPRPPQLQLPPDFFGTHTVAEQEEAQQLGPGTAVVPVRSAAELEAMRQVWEESTANHDVDLSHARVVSLEDVTPRSVVPRRLPAPPVSLDVEVDRGMEHERFHRQYLDARPAPRPTAASLLDELRNPDGARRAVLLAEILAPPVSLRE